MSVLLDSLMLGKKKKGVTEKMAHKSPIILTIVSVKRASILNIRTR